MSVSVIVASPEASKSIVISWHNASGETLSSTVTVAVHVPALPFTSVAVRVTVFGPTDEQSNEEISILSVNGPHASVEPPSTSDAVIVADPVASNCTGISWHNATELIASDTVTVEVHVLALPFTSVTVSVTVFAPIVEQSKDVISSVVLAIPQASADPASISPELIVAIPFTSRSTGISWHTAVGAILSSTVTTEVHADTFPLLSSTVSVTVLGPTDAQSNEVMSIDTLDSPHASDEPASMSVSVIVAAPEASNCTVISWHNASGETLSEIFIVALHTSVFPPKSVTVKVTGFAPMLEQSKIDWLKV